MAKERKCPECRTGGSANRKGKPGRCLSCIDDRYRRLGWNPTEPYVSSEHKRRCVCSECDQADLVPYSEVRNSKNRYCDWCSCRRMYEQGLVSDPSKWDITVERAAEVLLGDDFLVRGPAGEVLDAAELAARMGHVWSLVSVECVVCGTGAKRSVSMTLGSSDDPAWSRCSYCFSLPAVSWQEEFFKTRRLLRRHKGYARIGQRVAACCLDCGAERSISISDLKIGVAPCLGCAEAADPDAIHVVYLMHFPVLRAYKVGITSTEVRHDRIASHKAQGGVLLEQQEAPNKEAARTVEDFVLRAVRAFPSGCTSQDFPQGGFTETWSDDGPTIDLSCVVEAMERVEAPGFDRLRNLQAYFDSEPATIEELDDFRHIEIIEVDGTQVQQIGFSEPLEQMLRKIRSRRLAGTAGATEAV